MIEGFSLARPGTVFAPENGKLRLFKPGKISVLLAWPEPMALKKERSCPNWVHFRPEISIPRGDIEGRIRRLETPADGGGQLLLRFCMSSKEKESCDWLRWYAKIPEEIRDLVSRFRSRQWHVLSMLARCGEAALDLTASNPALAYALASNWVYHRPAVQRPLRSARALLKKKQRKILAWLGFPGTQSARKTLAKIVHKAIDVPTLLYVRQAMADPTMFGVMSNLRLNAGAIRIATDPELLPVASPTLLDEIAHRREEDQRAKAAYILRDSAAMYRLLVGRELEAVRCLSELRDLHEALIDDLSRARALDTDIPFPPPPVPGSDCIVPITNARDLADEGRAQHNCVASYVERVAVRQRVYIYRVLWPERCTLALTRRGNTWVPSELKRACNLPPSEATQRAVQQWLACELNNTACHPMALEVDEVPF